ncbi:MAG: glycosyltransferase [Methanotrichaceae archaeon]|nr:glycosyltransferase [Methanotrichaceae archaeon]
MSLTVAAMPAYNEERNIARMVQGAKPHVDMVVVVDDGSSDATVERAEAGAIVSAESGHIIGGSKGCSRNRRIHSVAHYHLVFSLGVGLA